MLPVRRPLRTPLFPSRRSSDLGDLRGAEHGVLHRGDRVAVAAGADPQAHDLGELLLQRHAVQQLGNAGAGGRFGGASVVLTVHGVGGGGYVDVSHGVFPSVAVWWGQPLTAPWRPLTMRFSIARKKTRAGIIASEVKASTPAVSWAYSVEKLATPSGRVWEAGSCSTRRGSR